MYRAYRNPYNLEDQLQEARAAYQQAIEDGADDDTLIGMAEEINELEQEANFAWQDDEYDADYGSSDWEEVIA